MSIRGREWGVKLDLVPLDLIPRLSMPQKVVAHDAPETRGRMRDENLG